MSLILSISRLITSRIGFGSNMSWPSHPMDFSTNWGMTKVTQSLVLITPPFLSFLIGRILKSHYFTDKTDATCAEAFTFTYGNVDVTPNTAK